MNQCRYCFEYIKPTKRLYPCNCKTPVHYDCLLRWNKVRNSNFTKCEICKYYYNSEWKNMLMNSNIYLLIKIFIFMICIYTFYKFIILIFI